MHRTDGDAHVSNLFSAGDPSVPRAPTQIDKDWLNAVQEEIVKPILDAGITLVKGTNTQLRAALDLLYVTVAGATNITGRKNFTSGLDSTSGTISTIWGRLVNGSEVEAGQYFYNKGQINCTNDLAASGVSGGSDANQITARAVHKAHASIVLNNTASPTKDANDCFNIGTVSVGSNILTIGFGTNFFAASCLPNVVVTLGDEMGTTIYDAFVSSRTRSDVNIKIRLASTGALTDPAGAALNGLRLYVHIEGKQ